MRTSRLAVPVVALLLASGPAIAQQAERYSISGDDIAIYNLAGVLRVEAGSGSGVTVEVTRGGRDAGKLRIERGPIRGHETLRVIYPDDAIVYGGGPEFARFLDIALDSASELEYHLILSADLKFLDHKTHQQLNVAVIQVKCMIAGLLRKLRADS